MRRLSILALAFAFTAITASPASAIEVHQHHERTVYKKTTDGKLPVRTLKWTEIVHVAPPDSDEDGLRNSKDDCPDEAGLVSLGGCQPEPVVATAVTTDPYSGGVTAPPVATGGGAGCTGMDAESGSAGYGAMSPTGYIGCYQIGPEHYAAGGSCEGLGTDPAGQDACAGVICDTEGAGAWTNDAGQNPCGRL